MCAAVGAGAPIDDFCFVNGETVVVVGSEAGHLANRAVNVDRDATVPANEVVVVIADPSFKARGGPCGLDSADYPGICKRAERVVYRLPRDRTEFGANVVGELIGGGVWLTSDRVKHGEALCRDLDAMATQQSVGTVWNGHASTFT